MCGIAGKVYLGSGTVNSSDLKKMASNIAHRGPDDQGIYISQDKTVGLVNRRLAIIDLTLTGHQPMGLKNRYRITFNGEIYNFQTERKKMEKEGYRFESGTDTEIILALYDKYQKGCLKYLRGMFAFAIFDEKEKTLFLARDRIGKKPLKYYWDGNVFIFASELKAFLDQKEIHTAPDWLAIHHYLTYGYVPPPQTGFEKIYKLEPGNYLWLDIKRKKFENKSYWKPDFSEKLHLSEGEWCERIIAELNEATKLRMIADVPIGAFLSGGVDSSSVVAIMACLSANPVKTFTIGFKDQKDDERPHAERIAKLFHTDHQTLIAEPESIEDLLPKLVYHYEEPYADSSAVATYMVSKLAKKYVSVILNGDGGDENFAGYDRYCRLKRDTLIDKFGYLIKPIGLPLSNFLSSSTNSKFWKKGYKFLKNSELPLAYRFATYNCYFKNEDKERLYLVPSTEKPLRAAKRPPRWISNSYELMRKKFEESQAADPRDQALYADLSMYFPEMLLTKVDIASMAVSLEARSPFLDHKMIELAAKIPFNLKVKGFCQHKYILKKAVEELIPKENIYRPKIGFTIPLHRWFTGKLNSYATGKLLTKKGTVRKYLNEDYIRGMLETHSKQTDFGPKLWSLLTLELWFKKFFN
ncbi:asparagine synthase (glutamine-hydrolyzing) [Candidatus Woesebacteria bacterium RIFCSPHIGHO2_01_FULL_38_10]|uniref:asparagine synthase (glutamine-hydrolyzing) n=1 Tax=Candidatus Woesebacteria bacterium RIFCSPLOWO2_01_FULL_39_10b TaxID=1802517 RepID=A0A1F8B5U6_9BACT|nr:MAG: asparagine synthase (glutamine-hydrolyzing) [Candidatus Woesebacteria bacterium RIFCSPHIGHO2_01_FULL_38_10]OGM59280.1 MAG: asparagine synthase (glutamine-hydrolyzing) [Candidatus Woesebacteria bacterium RIFCSPLOWO2_01_FULL_39_10b]